LTKIGPVALFSISTFGTAAKLRGPRYGAGPKSTSEYRPEYLARVDGQRQPALPVNLWITGDNTVPGQCLRIVVFRRMKNPPCAFTVRNAS